MKLSTRSRYGIIAVIDLATEFGGNPIPISTLAKSQGISEAYLDQLLRLLKKAGIIDTARGVAGGYYLLIEPEKLSAGEVINILEGNLDLVDCVGTEASNSCEKACYCSARPLFLKLQKRINDVLYDTSIAEMMNDYLEQKRRFNKNESIS